MLWCQPHTCSQLMQDWCRIEFPGNSKGSAMKDLGRAERKKAVIHSFIHSFSHEQVFMYSYSMQGTEPEPRNWMEHKTIRVSTPGTCLLVRETHGNCWVKNPYTACIVVSAIKETNNVISWRVSGEGNILSKVVKEIPLKRRHFSQHMTGERESVT